jgi:Ulp1 family protease
METDSQYIVEPGKIHNVEESTTSLVSDIPSFVAYGVSITDRDVASLAPCELINDNMVTVFLRYNTSMFVCLIIC